MTLNKAFEVIIKKCNEFPENVRPDTDSFKDALRFGKIAYDFEEFAMVIWEEPVFFNHCSCGIPDVAILPVILLLCTYHKVKEYNDTHECGPYGSDLEKKYWNDIKKIWRDCLDIDDVYGDPLYLYLAYDLDRVGCIEHGSSIGGAWITEFGEAVLTLFSKYIEETEKNNIE